MHGPPLIPLFDVFHAMGNMFDQHWEDGGDTDIEEDVPGLHLAHHAHGHINELDDDEGDDGYESSFIDDGDDDDDGDHDQHGPFHPPSAGSYQDPIELSDDDEDEQDVPIVARGRRRQGPIVLSDDEDGNPPTGIVHAEDDPYPHGYGVYEDDEDEYEDDEA